MATTIHLVDEGIDTGAIVSIKRGVVWIDRPIPRDLMLATNALYYDALTEFAANLASGERSIPATPQGEPQGPYLPRLCTEVNGAIDWSLSLGEIDRFIRGYSYPYSGAFTFVRNERISILKAEPEEGECYHSPVRGRVQHANCDGSIGVSIGNRCLRVHTIRHGQSEMPATAMLSPQDVLYTPPLVLEESAGVVKISETSSRLAHEVPNI